MAEKNSFLLYTDYFEQIELLSIEQRGILLTAIMSFQAGKDLPDMDAITKMCFSFISADMRRNNEKYEAVVEKRREAGRKGGYQKQANLANLANANFAKQDLAKENGASPILANLADNDSVSVNVNDSDSESVSVSVNVPTPANGNTQTHTHIPNYSEISEYCRSKGYQTDIDRFIQYNAGKGWSMEWKTAMDMWVTKDKDKQQEDRSKNRFNNFQNSQKYDFVAIEEAARKRFMEGERA